MSFTHRVIKNKSKVKNHGYSRLRNQRESHADAVVVGS